MSSPQTRQFRSTKFELEFYHPENWRVDENSADQSAPIVVQGSFPRAVVQPSVELTILQTNLDIESQVEQVAKLLSREKVAFNLVSKDIASRKDSSKHGVLVFTYGKDGRSMIGQRVLIPVNAGKFIMATAFSEENAWADCKDSFRSILGSVRNITAEDIEVVFTDTLQAQKPKAQAQTAAQVEGTKDFDKFAAQFDKRWKLCGNKKDLTEITKSESIAKVLWAALGSGALSWVTDAVPALNGKSARQCLATENGTTELKQFLLRLNEAATNFRELAGKPAERRTLEPSGNELEEIHQMLFAPENARDLTWQARMVSLLPITPFYVPDPAIVISPEGLPFYGFYTKAPIGMLARQRTLPEVIQEISEQGMGLVVNAGWENSLSIAYGSMWSYRNFGGFLSAEELNQLLVKNIPPTHKDQVFIGAPSEKLLPTYVRRVLKRVLEKVLKIKKPELFVYIDTQQNPSHIFYFNIFTEDYSDRREVEDIAQRLVWYFPPGITLNFPLRRTADQKDVFVRL